MDIMTPEQRSKNRSAIKSAGTQPEIRFQKALWHLGYRYRKNNRTVFGKPDITFKKQRLAIFIDSEFFHGKDWETKKRPQTNAEYWHKKINRNMERDREVNQYLTENGWTVLRFWSKEINKDLDTCLSVIKALLDKE